MRPNWFVAIPVESTIWLPQVLVDLPEECRGFDPTDTHITLAFLGAMGEEKVDAVASVMRQINEPIYTASLGPLRALPSPKRISALSFELDEGWDEVADLMARWRDPLREAAGLAPESRDPLPHVTVARPIRKHGKAGREAALDWVRSTQPPVLTLRLDRVALYTWAEDRRFCQFRTVVEHLFGV